MKTKKQTVIIIALAVLLVASIIYIGADKWQDKRQQELTAVYQQGYSQGITDAVTALYQQTQECKITTINLGNITRQVVDVDCVRQAVT
jgi:archaellum component FlaF (FlaF/FlaG flagellin family)